MSDLYIDPYLIGASIVFDKPRDAVSDVERLLFIKAFWAACEQRLVNDIESDKLQDLEDRSRAVCKKMFRMLKKRFPEGTLVEVKLGVGRNGSSQAAEVVHWDAERYSVRVRLLTAIEGQVRDFHWTKVSIWPGATDNL